MKKYQLVLFLLFFSAGYSFAQDVSKTILKSDKEFNEYNYTEAIKLYKIAILESDSSSHVLRRIAASYQFLHQIAEADLWYSKLMRRKDRTVEDIYNYILVLKRNDKYRLAEKMYDEMARLAPKDTRFLQFQNNKNYLNQMADAPNLYKISGVSFNSTAEDFAPVMHRKEIVFLSSKNYSPKKKANLDFYSVDMEVQENLKKKPFSKSLNSSFIAGPCCFFPDANEIYFTSCQTEGRGLARGIVERGTSTIMKAEIINGKWSKGVKIQLTGIGQSAVHPSISADGNTLYFSSNMPGGFGGNDLYKVERTNFAEEWSAPINLGPKINTEGNELYPFIHQNGNLYFASDGHLGLGGLDVFTVRLNSPAASVVNLGYGVNSNQDDFGFFLKEDKRSGFFSSNRDNGKGADDIYKFEIIPEAERSAKALQMLSDFGIVEAASLTNKNDNIQEKDKTLDSLLVIRLQDLPLFTDSLFSLKFDYKKIGSQETPLIELDFSQIALVKDSIQEKRIYYEKFSYDKQAPFKIRLTYPGYEDQLVNVELDNMSFLAHSVIIPMHKVARVEQQKPIAESKSFVFIGTIFEENTQIRLPNVRVIIKDRINNNQFVEVTGPYGTFRDSVTGYELYEPLNFEIYLKKEGYISKSFAFEEVLTEYGEIDLEEYLRKIRLTKAEVNVEIGKAANLNPIYFDLDQSAIRPDAAIELDKVVEILKEEPNLFIELGSHTDSRANDEYNLALSNRRSKSATDYIVSKGISAERLTSFGYGESQLVNRCANGVECTDEEHQMNRRTEFKIVKIKPEIAQKKDNKNTEGAKPQPKSERIIILFGTAKENGRNSALSSANIVVKNKKSGAVLYEGITDSRGYFKGKIRNLKLNEPLLLNIELSKEGFVSRTFEFNTMMKEYGEVDLNKLLKNFDLVKVENVVELGGAANINSIYFDPDKVEIREDAAVELDKIAATLLKEYTLAVEVSSHTDSRADDGYNLQLSKRRAEAIETYLVKKGISYGRITAKGYGEQQLLNKCANGVKCSEQEHEENRRTEFRIVIR